MVGVVEIKVQRVEADPDHLDLFDNIQHVFIHSKYASLTQVVNGQQSHA